MIVAMSYIRHAEGDEYQTQGEQSMTALSRINVLVVCAAFVFVGAIVIGAF